MKAQVLFLLVLLLQTCFASATLFKTLEDWKDEWKSLPPPKESEITALSGFYHADVRYASGLPIIGWFLQLFINVTWKGVQFDTDTRTAALVGHLFLGTFEEGTFSYNAESTHDGQSCLRVELGNRFYEGRYLSNGDILNIVTFTDGSFQDSGGISDVHVLSDIGGWWF